MPQQALFQIFHLLEDDTHRRLVETIKERMQCKSWGDARRIIEQRRVQVNGNLCLDPARLLTHRDVVKVWRESLPKPIDETSIRIVYVDDDLIVIDKPAGVTSVRHTEERHITRKRKQLQPTLDELVPVSLAVYLRRQRMNEIMGRGSSNEESNAPSPLERTRHSPKFLASIKRLAGKLTVIPVHRLDRDTSGLMVFARNRRTAVRLGDLFRRHAIDRRYLAVVHGSLDARTFDSYIIRDRGDGHRGIASDPIPEDAQRAITHVRPVEKFGGYSIIECKLETGRTHQIRIHLAAAGHPLCGENVYHRSVTGEVFPDLSRAPRQALHSFALRFVHPVTGKLLKFTTSWPDDLQRWLTPLKQEAEERT